MKKRTKIVTTLGPSSDSEDIIRKLYENGMNVARLNFSHGNYEYFKDLIKKIRSVSEDIAILLDTKGPELRTGEVENDEIILNEGDFLKLTSKNILGNNEKITLNYNKLNELEIGNRILIDDGLIELKIIEVNSNEIITKILNGGKLGSRKTVSIWGHSIKIPFLSKKDIEDIKFGIKEGVDFIAASFVRNAEEVRELKTLLKNNNGEQIKIISKIEHSESVKNIDEIIDESYGIMIARGDLAVEVPPEDVPAIQNQIILKCRNLGKPVIVATQMLESMKENPRPTRAEVSDVATAIMQGTDAIMLSGETANGKYPVLAVKMMTKIAKKYDLKIKSKLLDILEDEKEVIKNSVSKFITKSVYYASKQLNIKAILIPTVSGFTARNVSKFRPESPILAIVHDKVILRQLKLSWGIKSVYVKKYYMNKKDMLSMLKEKALDSGLVKNEEDKIIITSGHILNEPGHTNNMEIFDIKDM